MANPRVLVVDDDDDVRNMTRVSLSFEGFDVRAVADGAAALAAVRADPPDAVVLDVMMPGIDGLEVLRTLRADPAFADLPVLLLSAKAGAVAERDGWAAGATAYLTKPFTATALAAMLRVLLDDDSTDPRAGALARLDFAQRMNTAADRAAG